MMRRASRAKDRSFLESSEAPPVMERVATRVRKGTERVRNSAQRFCRAPPCLFQKAWMAALSYTRGRPSSSTATGPPARSTSALPLATYDLAASSGASTPRMRTALDTSTAATAAFPATSPTFATSTTPPRRARDGDGRASAAAAGRGRARDANAARGGNAENIAARDAGAKAGDAGRHRRGRAHRLMRRATATDRRFVAESDVALARKPAGRLSWIQGCRTVVFLSPGEP